MSDKPCTCHPDDNPPVPCPQKFALSECRAAAQSEIDLAKRTIEMLRTGDTCARHCEGTAYRIEARQLTAKLAAAQERAEKAEARVEECERIITAMTQWLDQQQPDVFRRGLWDAIAEGKK